MSEHKVTVNWKRTSKDFTYDSYNREHTWEFDNGLKVNASAAPEYKGSPSCVDPEETLAAAVAGCHMLTFLAIASKKGFVIESYTDHAVAHLEKNQEEKICVTRIELHPEISFGDKKPAKEELQRLHDSAHQHCFIANSILSKVDIVIQKF